jgi:hypothetical protein
MDRYRHGKRLVIRPPRVKVSPEMAAGGAQLIAKARELEDKQDRLEDDETAIRSLLGAIEDELERSRRPRLPGMHYRRRQLEGARARLRSRLAGIRSEREDTERSQQETSVAFAAHQAALPKLTEPAKERPAGCDECHQVSDPCRTAPAGKGWRRGWYLCGNCGNEWSDWWPGGHDPVVRRVP